LPVDPGHERCERCLFQRRVCLCGEIPTVPTRTHVVIVRHHLEQWRSSNTGRLAHFALPNSTLLDHGGSLGPATLPPMDGAWLVFPEGDPVHSFAEPPRQLVFLDATWSQARRMFRKLDGLRGLPLLRLPTDLGAATRRLRESPEPGKLSTIEAIAAALRLVEGDSVATPLEALFQVAVGRAAASGRNIAKPS
jgi:DTW domain-containing protein